jgi:hypothetical protein
MTVKCHVGSMGHDVEAFTVHTDYSLRIIAGRWCFFYLSTYSMRKIDTLQEPQFNHFFIMKSINS